MSADEEPKSNKVLLEPLQTSPENKDPVDDSSLPGTPEVKSESVLGSDDSRRQSQLSNLDRMASNLSEVAKDEYMRQASHVETPDIDGRQHVELATFEQKDGDEMVAAADRSKFVHVDDPKTVPSEGQKQASRKMLTEAFDVFDSDHGGSVEYDEVARIIDLVGLPSHDEDIKHMCNLLHIDEDGQISKEMFMKAFEPFCNGKTPLNENAHALYRVYVAIQEGEVEQLRMAFKTCDADGSGEIDREELGQVLATLGINVKGKEFDEMYNELDVDGDGGISFDEFINYMCKRKAKQVKSGKNAKFFNVEMLSAISSFMTDKKISKEESDRIVAKMPILEKVGANFMKKEYRRKGAKSAKRDSLVKPNEMHILTKPERIRLKRVEFTALAIDVLLGALSAIVVGLVELAAIDYYNIGCDEAVEGPDCEASNAMLKFYLWVGFASVIATVIEIVLIYYVHLKAAIKISGITGLKLFPVDKERAFVTAALARAALELPHPRKSELGIDPLAEASKTRLFIATLVYKAKTGLSTFILRLLFKRVLARVAAKSVLAFVAIPVQMFWNALIGYKCLRATRTIALGPSVAVEIFDELVNTRPTKPSADVKECIMRSIATVIIGVEEMHPNLRILLYHAAERLGLTVDVEDELDDAEQNREAMEEAGQRVEGTLTDAGKSEKSLPSIVVSPSSESKPSEKYKPPSEANAKDSSEDGAKNSADDADADANKDDKESADANADEDKDAAKKKAADDEVPVEKEKKLSIPRPGNANAFLAMFANLEEEDQQFVAGMYCFASVLNGYIPKRLMRIFKTMAAVGNLSEDEWPLRWLTFRFLRGEIEAKDVQMLFDAETRRQQAKNSWKQKCFHLCDRFMVCMAI